MNGYVRNKSTAWRHAMKRSIGPGHKIPLDELFEQYGEKHDLEEGQLFVEWLRDVKLRDTTVWEVKYTDGAKKEEPQPEEVEKVKEVEKAKEVKKDETVVVPFVKKDLEVSDIDGMSVR